MDKQEVLAALDFIETCLREIPLKELENEILIFAYVTNKEVLEAMEQDEVCLDRKIVAQHFYAILSKEMQRRDLRVQKVEIRITTDGKFISGREELKRGWKQQGDDVMLHCLDEWLEQTKTEAQRQALIDLAAEVIMET